MSTNEDARRNPAARASNENDLERADFTTPPPHQSTIIELNQTRLRITHWACACGEVVTMEPADAAEEGGSDDDAGVS